MHIYAYIVIHILLSVFLIENVVEHEEENDS